MGVKTEKGPAPTSLQDTADPTPRVSDTGVE